MPLRKSTAIWEGDLPEGKGTMRFESSGQEFPYSFTSRFSEGEGSNPEEMLGAAHAGCFSMQLANLLAQDGSTAKKIKTNAKVSLAKAGDGYEITRIVLDCEAIVPGINEETFLKKANEAKETCPVSKALKSVDILVQPKLLKG